MMMLIIMMTTVDVHQKCDHFGLGLGLESYGLGLGLATAGLDYIPAWAPAHGGQGGQLPTLEKIRVGHAHPGNINRGLKSFRQ